MNSIDIINELLKAQDALINTLLHCIDKGHILLLLTPKERNDIVLGLARIEQASKVIEELPR
jgi:Mg/Co/Ni transporter MgtE